MNAMLLNFCLMLFWAFLSLYLLVFGPLLAPDRVPGKGQAPMLGIATALLAIWNFVRFWSMRSERKWRRLRAEAYREEKNPTPASDQPKPVLHPEFQFDDPAKPPK